MKPYKLISIFLISTVITITCIENAISQEKSTLSVYGKGNVTFIPDMVTINISVRFVNPKLDDSLLKTKKTITNILSICKEFGIADKDIKTSYINSDKEYNLNIAPPKFLGFVAIQSTQIIYRDLQNFEKFTKALLGQHIDTIDSIIFSHSKFANFASESDLLALDDAKASAERIAERMKVKLGKVISISNIYPPEFDQLNYSGRTFSKGLSSGIAISPGILSINSIVRVVFEIH